MTEKPQPILYLDECRGHYIPRDFANNIDRVCVHHVSDAEWNILENPNHEEYWSVWQDVCDNARVTNPQTNVTYFVYHELDCWLIPVGMEQSLGTNWFSWPNEHKITS